MDLSFIYDLITPAVLGLCAAVGYIIKTSLDFIPNKYIPLVMGVFGVIVNCVIYENLSVEIILGGLISGLASTGMYELFRNLIISQDKNI